MSQYVFHNKIGEGTYGTVYLVSEVDPKTKKVGRKMAIKRNFKPKTMSFMGTVVELDMLVRFKNHPCIVDLDTVSFRDPLSGSSRPMTPGLGNSRRMDDDHFHFIMEYLPYNAYLFPRDRKICRFYDIKTMLCQILIAVEYIHAKGVTHRDLKPENILLTKDTSRNVVYAKLCDFGTTSYIVKEKPTTPGVVTSWYRAPEICYRWKNYTQKIDMWSIGALMFEFLSGCPLVDSRNDIDANLISLMIRRFPKDPSNDVLAKLENGGEKIHFDSKVAYPDKRSEWIEQFKMTEADIKEFNSVGGSLDEYIEIMNHLLDLDPDTRWTATQTLEHRFFSIYRRYIRDIRLYCPPIPDPYPVVKIVKCIERKWAAAITFQIYNDSDKYIWYHPRILFHTLRLYDNYLAWAFKEGNSRVKLQDDENSDRGRLHNRSDAELRFYVCLYLTYKYFSSIYFPIQWDSFVPSIYTTSEMKKEAENFEHTLVYRVLNYRIYDSSLLEMISISKQDRKSPQIITIDGDKSEEKQKPNEKSDEKTQLLIRDLLSAYGRIEDYEGPLDELYQQIMSKL